MPYVKSISLHTTINRSIAYILNPEKTDGLLYTTSLNCMTEAKSAYLAMKTVYEHFSGEKFNAPLPLEGKGRVKAIHYIQSFDPKENITPELLQNWKTKLMEVSSKYDDKIEFEIKSLEDYIN